MKTLELFFNNEQQDSIYESWCFEPDSQQENNLGNLYLIAKLEGKDSNSLNLLASSISNAYSTTGSLESAVKLAKKKIKERGLNKLEIVILAVNDKELEFTKTQGVKIALLRNREVINIGSKLKKDLTNIGTVKLKPEDKILAITNEAWRKLRQKHLVEKAASRSQVEPIRKVLTTDEVPGVALMIILRARPLQSFKRKFTDFFQKISEHIKMPAWIISKRSTNTFKTPFLQRRINAAWPQRKAQQAPFLIALFYLLSFISIRLLVTLVGSVNSPVAQTVEETSSLTHFHIGRNIILFGYHIHHFYFGILLIATAGWLAITNSAKISERGLAVTYGIGLGFLMDEIGLLLTWGNYTSSLSYLLGVLLLAILLNIIYFPSFWKKVRTNTIKRELPSAWLNKALKGLIQIADKISGRN